MAASRPKPHFTTLPREIRDRVYYFLLDPSGICIDASRRSTDPPLSRTCRQVRDEVLGPAYRHVTIHPLHSFTKRWEGTIGRWIAQGKFGRLQYTRQLTLVIDEESGYNGAPLKPRKYTESPWATALPELIAFFNDRAEPLRNVEVCVQGKKKCSTEFEHRNSRIVSPSSECYYADTSDVYAGFLEDLLKLCRPGVIELGGIFPTEWDLALEENGLKVIKNFDGFFDSCFLFTKVIYSISLPHINKIHRLKMEWNMNTKRKGSMSLEFESSLRRTYSAMESAWRRGVVDAENSSPRWEYND